MIQKVTLSFFILILITLNIKALSFSKVENKKYNIIYAKGRIENGDSYNLERIYKSLPSYKQTLVIFNSNGGELSEGIKLGKFIYKNKIATAVQKNSICASSCALAFLGGRDLYGRKLMILQSNTKIGFHNFYYKNRSYVSASQVQKDLSNLIDYFYYVNAPSKLMYKMLKTKPQNMFWISNRIHKNILNTKKLSLNINILKPRKKSIYSYNKNIYTSNYSKKNAIEKYFYNINLAIKSNNDYMHNYSHTALNINDYQSWLSSKLNYVHANSFKILSRNIIKVNVTYSLKNGRKIYSNNIYRLQRTQYGWRVVSKRVNPLRRYKRIARGLENKLP